MSKRAGLVAAVWLVLLAGLVVGGETRFPLAPLATAPHAASPSPAPPPPPPQASEELDVEKLHRAKRGEPIVDVFAPKAVAALPAVLREVALPPPPPPAPAEPAVSAPPPPPGPPALPFRLVA